MAKRKVASRSSRAARAPKRAAATAKRTRAATTPAKRSAAKGSRSGASRKPAAKRAAARTTARPKAPAARRPQESTGRGAAQPGGRRTVELFARAQGEEGVSPNVPSSLDLDRHPSAARSGRAELEERYREHHETGPGMTAGDIDADWESAYSVGDEAPGGDNPTPGQVVVEDVGKALGVEYEDEEELKGAAKIEGRDRHRWELDPASSEDYPERTKGGKRKKR